MLHRNSQILFPTGAKKFPRNANVQPVPNDQFCRSSDWNHVVSRMAYYNGWYCTHKLQYVGQLQGECMCFRILGWSIVSWVQSCPHFMSQQPCIGCNNVFMYSIISCRKWVSLLTSTLIIMPYQHKEHGKLEFASPHPLHYRATWTNTSTMHVILFMLSWSASVLFSAL